MLGGSDIVSYSWNAGDKEVSRSEKFTVSDDLLGKTIYVIVTDSEGNIATSEETAAVTGEAIVSEVTLDNITPAVGDKITASAFDAEGNDVSAQCTWQWFRVTAEGNVVKISNATKQSYTVGAIDRGAVLYCEATDTNGNLLKSNESSVMKATNITEINVNGMTGQRPGDKDEFVAVAGDELEVELVPYGAANDASYQWYRGGAAIKGATEKTYVPTTADVNLELSVKVSIPSTAGYGISEDATTTNATLVPGTTVSGANYSLTATVTLDDVVCWDLSNSTPVLDNTKPAVGDTITVKVPFDKNGDGDEKDTGDYLDLTSDTTPDATVVWYRGSIEAKNKVGEGASYDVVKDDNGKALYAVVTGRPGSEFIGSCEATTDEANKTVMNTVISRETPTVTSTEDMVSANAAMTKGTKLYASTKDNNNDAVKDANLTFQWYRGGAAIDGATSSSYTLGDDDIAKFKKDGDQIVSYRVVVTGKDGYTGSAKDTIEIKGATSATATQAVEDISVKRGDYYLAGGDTVNAGDELKLAASFADSLSAMNVVWWYSANGRGTDAEKFTGTSFTVPSTATTDAKIAVSLTVKADNTLWSGLNFTTCTTNTTKDTDKTSSLTANLAGATNRVIYGASATIPTNWADLTGAGNKNTKTLSCAKALDSITVTYKVGDRTLTAPEVGATMSVSVKPQLSDLTYKWTVNGALVDSEDEDADKDNPATAKEAGEGANTYKITSANVNKKIKVEATAGNASTTYQGAKISYESEAVAASSRTIAAMKVLKYDVETTKGTKTDTWYVDKNHDFLNDKADFTNKKSVSAIATGESYIIVAMDSDGELITDDVYYNLYNFKSGVEKKVGSDQIFAGSEYFKAGDIAHFEVAPNQIGYTGSAVNYNLASAVSDTGSGDAGEDEVAIVVTPVGSTKNYNVDRMVVSNAAPAAGTKRTTFEATVTGVDGNPTIKWCDGKGATVKVGATFEPIAAGLDGTAGKDAFYAEITVNGTSYASDVWSVKAPAATYIGASATDNSPVTAIALETTYGTPINGQVVGYAYDQFGNAWTTAKTKGNITDAPTGTNTTTSAYDYEIITGTGAVKISSATANNAGKDEFELLECEFTSTIAVKAGVYAATAASNDAIITLTTKGTTSAATVITVTDGGADGTLTAADIDSITVTDLSADPTELTGTVGAGTMVWTASANGALTNCSVTITLKGNYSGTIVGYFAAADSAAGTAHVGSATGAVPA